MQKQKSIIFIYGPTGVGKSDYALLLQDCFPLEIINCDVGQLYTPLSIGTAKPDLASQSVPHHLFNVLDTPSDYTVVEYKKALLKTCQEVWDRNAQPVVVGGSGFYIASFFYPPVADHAPSLVLPDFSNKSTQELWEELEQKDPARAQKIHPNDRYRIERALTVSSLQSSVTVAKPVYVDPGIPYLVLCLTRSREQLYERINQRTQSMLRSGWAEEVAGLPKEQWGPFLKRKKLIGYDILLNAQEDSAQIHTLEQIEESIAQKTRHYAKRQMTFWRMLKKNLDQQVRFPSMVQELELDDTKESVTLYKTMVEKFISDVEGNAL